MENLRFGGNTSQQEISNIMLSNAKKYTLSYSHKKENRWNLWVQDSGATLSFVLNNGLFIPSVSGTVRKTLEKFYSTCPADVDLWVKADIKQYLKIVKSTLIEEEERREAEAYEEYLRRYYAEMQAIDEDNDRVKDVSQETECQKFNREHNTFYTEEEYEMMFPKDNDIQPEQEEVKKLVRCLQPKRRKDKQIPGQLSLFDLKEFNR